jgi:hypothetical protein
MLGGLFLGLISMLLFGLLFAQFYHAVFRSRCANIIDFAVLDFGLVCTMFECYPVFCLTLNLILIGWNLFCLTLNLALLSFDFYVPLLLHAMA